MNILGGNVDYPAPRENRMEVSQNIKGYTQVCVWWGLGGGGEQGRNILTMRAWQWVHGGNDNNTCRDAENGFGSGVLQFVRDKERSENNQPKV